MFDQLNTLFCRNHDEYEAAYTTHLPAAARMAAFERSLAVEETFELPGYCLVCDKPTRFRADFLYHSVVDGVRVPNWRERLECSHCGLNSRMRAAMHFLKQATKGGTIYLTEQATNFFTMAHRFMPNVVGSEYLSDGTIPGQTNAKGIRCEDMTRLTFPDRSFDVIASYDVLEHVPDYRAALAECWRCLKPGGVLNVTVPFLLGSPQTVTRAVIAADGSITHLQPPEYHGDPLSKTGVLAFYNFGWDLLADMEAAGFGDVGLTFYWSYLFGHIGGWQFIITARKAG